MREELKQRLLKHISFLEAELKDFPEFKSLTKDEYIKERNKRRNVERWIENIINSSIDISKLLLTLEGISLPDNYKDIVLSISHVKDLNFDKAETISRWVKFRNIVAHEYLDIRWLSIKKFITEAEPVYNDFLNKIKNYLEKKITENKGKL